MPQDIVNAKEKELNNLIDNNVFQVVPFKKKKNKQQLFSHRIISEKYDRQKKTKAK